MAEKDAQLEGRAVDARAVEKVVQPRGSHGREARAAVPAHGAAPSARKATDDERGPHATLPAPGAPHLTQINCAPFSSRYLYANRRG